MPVVARDLMRNTLMVGNAHFANARVTRLEAALEKIESGDNFYWQPRRDLFYVNLYLYEALGISHRQVSQRLSQTTKERSK